MISFRRLIASGVMLLVLLVVGAVYALVHGGAGAGDTDDTAPSCPTCTIRVTQAATLGRRTDSVSPDTWAELAHDSRGRYYVAPTVGGAQIAVYDSLGRFMRTIGQRGDGPGEFQRIQSITVGMHDTLFVLDFLSRRLTVLSPGYHAVRTMSMAKTGYHLTILRDGRMLVGYLSAFPGPSAGEPIHLLSASGAFVRSFGVVSPDFDRERFSSNARTFAVARSGDGVWVAPSSRYELELWDLDGHPQRSVSRSVDWFPPWTDLHHQPINIVKPRTALGAIRQDAEGRLWVFLSVADKNWRRGHEASHMGENGTPVYSGVEKDRYLDTMVEVIDPRRGRLVASVRMPVVVEGLVGDDLAYSWRSDSLGYDHIDIWRLRLTGATAR
jgi:hypothetical protein